MVRQNAGRAFLALFTLCCLFAPPVQAQETKYDPATTTVALLPVIDKTGEKLAERRKLQADTGTKNLIELFARRGFQLAKPEAVTKAISDLKINLDDEEDYRRATFYQVGKAVKADLVVFVVIQETREDTKTSLFKGSEKQGRATVKMWFLDVKRETPILSAVVKEGKAAGSAFLGGALQGTQRRANAVGNAIKEQMEAFLKPYPETKKVEVSKEGKLESITDK